MAVTPSVRGTDLIASPRSAGPPERPAPERWASEGSVWALAALIFGGSFLLRWLNPGWVDDHFRLLAQARQILAGELPFRDFPDPGVFLQIHASAAFQLIFGYRLLGEALLCISLLSAGYALTFLLAARTSRSVLIGLVVTVSVIAMNPRLYAYDKVFLLPFGLFVCWRYVGRATIRNLAVVGLSTAFAFLFRHDHGVYIGAAATALVVSVHWNEGPAVWLRRLALYGAFVAAPLVPFVVFLQTNGGVVEYFRSAIEYTRVRGEGKRVQPGRPTSFMLDPFAESSGPDINVRWVADVTDDVRAGLEQQYHLAEPELVRGVRWQYKLLDSSAANVSALVADPRVANADGINRAISRQASGGIDIFRRGNAVAWLYYLFVALPVVAVIVLLVKRRRWPAAEGMPGEGPKILCAAILCVVADRLLLRHPLEYRLADAAAPTAVIAAWLLGHWFGAWSRRPARRGTTGRLPRRRATGIRRFAPWPALPLVRSITALALIVVTWTSIATVTDIAEQLEGSRVLSGPSAVGARAAEVSGQLLASPPIEAWAPPGSTGLRALTRYVHECTKPTDRVLVTWFAPDVYYYSGRGFAGGQVFWFDHYLTSPEEQRSSVEKLRAESVPIIVGGAEGEDFATDYRYVHEYIADHYRTVRESDFGDEGLLQVLVDRRVAPSGTYPTLSLPCFR